MRRSGWGITSFLVLVVAAPAWAAQPTSFEQVISRINQRETQFAQNMRNYAPMVETYIQDMKPDAELGEVPSGDTYFLGRLDLSRGVTTASFVPDRSGWFHHLFGSLGGMQYNAAGFAVISPDENQLDSAHYDFTFVRREFLGDVRCLVFDVVPRKNTGQGRFLGRLWVEDQDYDIVRFNGTFVPRPRYGYYFHFDSWRLNMGPNLWLPAYSYSEELNMKYSMPRKHLSFKAQTRFWAYNVHSRGRQDELTQVLVEPAPTVKDQSDNAQDLSPVQAQRMWARESEENVLDKLERVGLLAHEGEVDKVLDTVINNIAITNKIDIQPEIRCRVLLTAPMESFTVGHTIVMSRGLLDVLPDEATLAAVLAHEMSHILLAHGENPMYGFNDKMLFPERQTFTRLTLSHPPDQEQAADAKALDLLKNSPYKDQLANAGLFLRALQQRAPVLPNLIRAHLGNGLTLGGGTRMSDLIASAPALEMNKLDQIAALPMGARIKVDPWNDRAQMSKAKPVGLLSAREKMFFEVTPVYPYLTRVNDKQATEKVAATKPGQQ
ncbi:MAG TPA: M48 family metalloprotease [Terriglobales bacterium]|nr:M48 family metalloprotease [Terriglobales bacterium]